MQNLLFTLIRTTVVIVVMFIIGQSSPKIRVIPPTNSVFAAPDAKAQIVIHPNQVIGSFDERLLGSNVPAWFGDRLQNATLRTRTRASGIRTLRIPGGSYSDDFGWWS